jgi:hypothetical protein
VKLTAVSCPPVVEVKIKRPDTKYQLGFSVQNGVVSIYLLTILKKVIFLSIRRSLGLYFSVHRGVLGQ